MVESLEPRDVPSAMRPDYVLYHPAGDVPNGNFRPVGFAASQIRGAYGINQITFSNGTVTGDGTGQTIAIVDAYNDPDIFTELDGFDQVDVLTATRPRRCTSSTDVASTFLTVYNQSGTNISANHFHERQ